MSELSEDSKFEISIKTLIAIGVGIIHPYRNVVCLTGRYRGS